MKYKRLICVLILVLMLLTLMCGCSNKESEQSLTTYNSLEELSGKKIGVQTGSVFDEVIPEYIENAQVEYYNSAPDLCAALEAGKIDAYIADEPIMRMLLNNYPNEKCLSKVADDEYGFIFPKDDDGNTLRNQFNEFLIKAEAEGVLKETDDIWFGTDESKKVVDLSGLTGENGTLKFGVCSDYAPFGYIKDGKLAGYELDLGIRFCREYGYDVEIIDYNLQGLLAAVSVGKVDFGANCISITEERKETFYFSEPTYIGGITVITRDGTAIEKSIVEKITESFRKTFVDEDRWKLFVNGIGITIFITVISALFGTGIGMLLFFEYRKRKKLFNGCLNVLIDIFEKTPIVVFLMILYYIVFGNSDLKGVWISIIGFTFVFACNFVQTIDSGVRIVDRGQTEASLALGFTDKKSFTKIVLPQAVKNFLPSYKSSIVSLLNNSAVVGYISVQDLTRVSDIVRGRTYEAFFPLIITAVIYFILAWILTLLIMRIEINFDTKKRSEAKILKGVNR